ncbi:unnamed protein product [Closterium sp. Yama58-4]|nr:unnamed protein product [Closterium sp. Yama58-4]
MAGRSRFLLAIALLLSSTCQCGLAVRRAPAPKSTSLYIVRLRSALPLAAYRGGIASFSGWTDDGDNNAAGPSGLRATAATVAHEAATLAGSIPRRARLSMENPQLKAYAQMLETQQIRIASDVGVTSDRIVYNYMHASNGFAAALSPQQVRLLQRHPAVAAVTRSRRVTPLTIDSPTFLGMRAPGSLWPANGGQASAGKGMVVGVVDTGIWPEHPSFSDAGFPSSKPAGWSGKCDTTSEFKCNNKIIGARAFYQGFKEDNGGPDLSSGDWLSPRDSYGHGTWCAGAAAGNKDVPMAGGKASGMAPAARLAMYKVFWYSQGALFAVSADIEAAVNQAVADGVDVLSLSLGGLDPSDTYFSHMPFLAANLAGVFVSYAAGNEGPYSSFSGRTVDNFSPFYLTVGASTIGRGGLTLKATTAAAAAALSNASSSSSSATPAATAYPSIAEFSSTGPLADPSFDVTGALPTNSILKPDIVGPGVDLFAAWPAKKVGKPGSYAQLSGTSMATPHLAGIAALIMQKYPKWSPAQVMSAIMTTAKTTDTTSAAIKNAYGEVATPWDMGAGQVFPAKVLDPGLTFDARAAAYKNFLAGQSMKRAQKEFPGANLTAIPPRELNRPSISISRLKGTLTATRTDGKVTFTVTFKVTKTFEDFQFGSLTWADDLPRLCAMANLVILVSSLLLLAALPTPTRSHGSGEPQITPPGAYRDAGASMYIVRLRSAPPLAAYRGEIAGYPATVATSSGDDPGDGDGEGDSWAASQRPVGATAGSGNSRSEADSGSGNLTLENPGSLKEALGSPAAGRARMSMRAPHVRAYAELLARMQAEVASEVGIAADNIAYSYKHVTNGFAALLSPAQLRRLARHPAVASARPSRQLRPDTIDSPTFLGLEKRAGAKNPANRGSRGMWRALGGKRRAGEGMVVGVIDSGIWPEHPSFSDRNFSASRPNGWSGSCDATSDFRCNNKIIGARIFNAAFRAKHGKPDLTTDWLSPRDGFGHGTWCAGAAAGNSGVPMAGGRASGMAPAARLAAYKVFWYSQGDRPEFRALGGESADLLAAVNQAVADGVHVLSISLSADDPEATYFDDVAYMNANLAGVTVVMSAGNNGAPLSNPLNTYRTITNFSPFYLTVGASSITRGGVSLASSPASDEERGSSEAETDNQQQAETHQNTAAAMATVGANSTGTTTSSSSTTTTTTESPPQPASSITATTSSVTTVGPVAPAAPVVAAFSSSGPLHRPWSRPPPGHATNSLLKPDVIGPGVDLWAAWVGTVPGEAGGRGGRGGEASQLSGTSMATPHLAGIAALIMQKHPSWSPAQVMSAIMTTAITTNTKGRRILNERGGVATPWEMGSGHVFPKRALNPGLTYDARRWAYVNFLAGQDYRAAKREFPGTKIYRKKPWNLNRPTISVARLKGAVEVFRTVAAAALSFSTAVKGEALSTNHVVAAAWIAPRGLGVSALLNTSRSATPSKNVPVKKQLRTEDGIFGTSGGFGFTKANELFVGRVAMLGFAASLLGEAITGQGILSQLNLETGIPITEAEPLLLFFIAFTVLGAIGGLGDRGRFVDDEPAGPPVKPQSFKAALGLKEDGPLFGFTKANELFVGRMAQLGFAASLIGEVVTGRGALAQLNIETGLPVWELEPLLLASIAFFFVAAINPGTGKFINDEE